MSDVPTVPVVEVFGPTIQGEGPCAGTVTDFVRLGGCDYRCSWCDSLFAVLPEQWKDAPRLGPWQITDQLCELGSPAQWVTISGGNPALYDLTNLVDLLHDADRKVALETQGSVWQDWMVFLDALVLSPKPPSSGMVSERHDKAWLRFLDRIVRTRDPRVVTGVKVVVFDDTDYEWAAGIISQVRDRDWWMGVSVGTDPPQPNEQLGDTIIGVADRWGWLAERVAYDPRMRDVHVLPQLHVMAWGHARAV